MRFKMLLLIILIQTAKCISQENIENIRFIGAELSANMLEPGKLKISLQVFYDGSQKTVPEKEIVSVFESDVTRTLGIFELKKESESIFDKYDPVGNSTITIPSIKSVEYQGEINLGLFKTSYDVTWAYTGLIETFNNIELKQQDAIALLVHIRNPTSNTLNKSPMFDHLPMQKVSSNSNKGYLMDLKNKDETEDVEMSLSCPHIYSPAVSTIPRQGSIPSVRPPFSNAVCKPGFSISEPVAKIIYYDPKNKQVISDHPKFGKYLISFIISDFRNDILMSQHPAIFILESMQ